MVKQPQGQTRDISKKEKWRRNNANQAAEEMFNKYVKPGLIIAGVTVVLFLVYITNFKQ
jgi:hypothetical protein